MSKKSNGHRKHGQKRGHKNQKRKQNTKRQAASRAADRGVLETLSVWEGARGPAGTVRGDGGGDVAIDWVLFAERPSGIVVGSRIVESGDEFGMGRALAETIAEPGEGLPRRPRQVLVSLASEAASIRGHLGDVVRVEVGPTPHAIAAGRALTEYLEQNAGPGYLAHDGITADVAEAFFEAMAELDEHREILLGAYAIRIDSLDTDGPPLVAALWPADPQGILLSISEGIDRYRVRFGDVEDAEADGPSAAGRARTGKKKRPKRAADDAGDLCATFVPLAELPPAVAIEIHAHGWRCTPDGRCPTLVRVSLDDRDCPVAAPDYRRATQIARVLTKLAREDVEMLTSENRLTHFAYEDASLGQVEVTYPGDVDDAVRDALLAKDGIVILHVPAPHYEVAIAEAMLTPKARQVLESATRQDDETYRLRARRSELDHIGRLLVTLSTQRGQARARAEALDAMGFGLLQASVPPALDREVDASPRAAGARGARGARWATGGKRGAKKPKPSPGKRQLYQLKVTLRGIRPPIWRRLEVRSDIALDGLHRAIQDAMGWTDSHLHHFEHDGTLYGEPDPDFDVFDATMVNERTTRLDALLRKPKASLAYVYDFGDHWEHTVVLEKATPLPPGQRAPRPRCIGGKRACPPEDCGGVHGYTNMLRALRDPDHPEHEQYREWLGEEFDPEKV